MMRSHCQTLTPTHTDTDTCKNGFNSNLVICGTIYAAETPTQTQITVEPVVVNISVCVCVGVGVWQCERTIIVISSSLW